MARFFIDRPIFAWVIAIVIMLAGAASITTLPIEQYPQIAPTSISIGAGYPGANAKAVEDSVTQVIEQTMKGLDGLLYMSSSSESNGQMGISLTFAAGVDPDIAQVQVQNKLQLAIPLLPQEVQRQGIVVTKSSSGFLMVIGFVSEDGAMNDKDIGDFVATNVVDVLARVEGVGNVQSFGGAYSMRIWLDPDKLRAFNLTPLDVSLAIQAQNTQVSAGQLGGAPAIKGQQLNATITAQSRLNTKEQFDAIFLRINENGSEVKLKDVARVELGGANYDFLARYNGKPASGCAIILATGANALDTAKAVKEKLKELEPYFPKGLRAVTAFDTTPFIEISIQEVLVTLAEAIGLVFLVMLIFLQNFRATLIPTIAVPVVLLGTMAVLQVFGFSINTLTMFGIVLAIGLLVDDAIVVVENVERIMREEGLSPKEATKKSMTEITSALIGISLVLSAVFVPMAFFGGSTGVIYRQFSITIVTAMLLSVLVALVLTPALTATLLKPHKGKPFIVSRFFNRGFDGMTRGYVAFVRHLVKRGFYYMVLYAGIAAAMVVLFLKLPTSFLPNEDQGALFAMVMLPTGATQERTLKTVVKVEEHFMQNEARYVDSLFTVLGFSFGGSGQNTGIAFVNLKPWDERAKAAKESEGETRKMLEGMGMKPEEVAKALDNPDNVAKVVERAGALFMLPDGMAFAFAPPPVPELGTASGFDFQLQDRAGLGHDALIAARNQLVGMAMQDARVTNVRANGMEDQAELKLEVDHKKAGALGVSVNDINYTLAAAWGGAYVNDFIDRNRVKRVFMQADAPFRMVPEDINRWFVRNTKGQMVPFSAFATTSWAYGSPRLERFNGLPSVNINGQAKEGISSGEAMLAMEELAAKLPAGIGLEWTGLSYQERLSGSQAPLLYALSLLVIFLCLAALYESWSIPFAVLLVVPLGVIGALLAALLRDMSNDVYFQVGLLTTVGLAAKNAILIVEFAKTLVDRGQDVVPATIEAARLRLRPILMTSFAFGLGVLPLALSSGAGSGSRNAVGTGVFGGMITATVLGVLFVPVFFVVIAKIFGRRKKPAPADVDHGPHDDATRQVSAMPG